MLRSLILLVSTLSCVLAECPIEQRYPNYPRWNHPRPDNWDLKEVEDRPINVLVQGVMPGSMFKNQMEKAKGLAKVRNELNEPMFNVTMMVPRNLTFKAPESVNVIRTTADTAFPTFDMGGKNPA